MNDDLRKFALRLKLVELIDRYSKLRKQMYTMSRWRRWLVHPN